MDPGRMLLEDFGQRVDLTRRIREGTTALRELIQNADDAGASRVRLCLDRRIHGASSLLAPALAQWQGPALLAHNDAAFTDEDFQSTTGCRSSPIQASAALLRLLHLLPLQAEDDPATKL